jgi:hypothetical protein
MEQDWNTLHDLLNIHCTEAECCGILRVDKETLVQLMRERTGKPTITFPEYAEPYQAEGKRSLRRRQYQLATEEGNPTMLIWLGKQWLGQADKQEVKQETTHKADNDTLKQVASLDLEGLIALGKGLHKAGGEG